MAEWRKVAFDALMLAGALARGVHDRDRHNGPSPCFDTPCGEVWQVGQQFRALDTYHRARALDGLEIDQ